ncbi:transcriptional regulator, TetR family [Roseateles sp. YR242]|uniref:TetR/AcrR family transcriptional regulator n=1 Tax=Roseateles sp. YR242 TaxID=1855305 RepID=UPI0008CB4DF5|nr:TetR/AcrR family transcriptional regulator [Roseateles sp. YR242]SEL38978.1 transcriptional regulator, TetR family [Roseateles sp. YR242]
MDKDKLSPILDAASSVFLRHGFTAATTDMIQREAGVSKATLYANFAGKEALFAAVIERQCTRLADAVQAIEPVPGNLAKTLTALGRAYLEIVLSPGGLALFRVVVAEAPRFPELARHFYLRGPRLMAAAVVERLTVAVQQGEIDVQAIGLDAAASIFVALVRSEGQLECLTHPAARPSEIQLDTWVRLAVETFLAAYGTQPRA